VCVYINCEVQTIIYIGKIDCKDLYIQPEADPGPGLPNPGPAARVSSELYSFMLLSFLPGQLIYHITKMIYKVNMSSMWVAISPLHTQVYLVFILRLRSRTRGGAAPCSVLRRWRSTYGTACRFQPPRRRRCSDDFFNFSPFSIRILILYLNKVVTLCYFIVILV
jgi:hypothetical protein